MTPRSSWVNWEGEKKSCLSLICLLCCYQSQMSEFSKLFLATSPFTKNKKGPLFLLIMYICHIVATCKDVLIFESLEKAFIEMVLKLKLGQPKRLKP